jgi:hypothetical protein
MNKENEFSFQKCSLGGNWKHNTTAKLNAETSALDIHV